MIRAIIFDYGGVLMRTADPTPRRDMERRFNLAPGSSRDLVFGSSRWDEVQLGHISSGEFWDDLGGKLGLGADELEAFREGFWAGDRLDEELVTLIRRLRDKGYRTALLNNAPADLRRYVEELGIADAFDVTVISGGEGVMKPDPAIYELALERLGVAAGEAIFVDDMRENVEAARRLGVHAVRFEGLAPLRQWLSGQGVSFPDPTPDPLTDVRAVIFDWGGVMEDNPSDAHVASWARRLALSPGTLAEILWGEPWYQLSRGEISEDAYLELVAEGLGFPDREAADRFTEEFYTDHRFNPRVAAAARALRDHYKVALLSNAWAGQGDAVRERFGVDVETDFDVYVNSAHVGLRKPDPAIYHLALERLGVEPEQAVFLDDRLHNVDSAREVGINAIQFVDPDTSLARLEALLGHPIEG